MAKTTHTVMPRKLAEALMEAGVQHFDVGGESMPAFGPGIGGAMQKRMWEQQAPQRAQAAAAENKWQTENANNFAPSAAGRPGGAAGATKFGDAGLIGSIFGQNSFQANMAPTAETDYSKLVGASANQSQNIQQQQQDLANALLAQSQGGGPNPAQAALAQNTGANIAAQNALMAGQRGASANPALLARQAAMQGANAQQGAVGQAATMQAQQQLAAQAALAQQQATMGQQNLGLLGTATGAQNTQNQNTISNYGMAQGLNADVSKQNAKSGSDTLGKLAGTVGGALAGPVGSLIGGLFAKGGEVPEHMQRVAAHYHGDGVPMDFGDGGDVPGEASVSGNSFKNDTVPALLSPKEVVLPRSVTLAPDAPKRAADFMRHLMEKNAAQTGYSRVAAAKSKKSAKASEKRVGGQ